MEKTKKLKISKKLNKNKDPESLGDYFDRWAEPINSATYTQDTTDTFKTDYKTDNCQYTVSCVNLLPCGICRLTNQQCPKHLGSWNSPIRWNEWTCKTSEFDSNMSNSYTTKVDGNLKSNYITTQQDLEDFFNDR